MLFRSGFVGLYFQEDVKMSADRIIQVIFDRELCRYGRFWDVDLIVGEAGRRRVGDGWWTTKKNIVIAGKQIRITCP